MKAGGSASSTRATSRVLRNWLLIDQYRQDSISSRKDHIQTICQLRYWPVGSEIGRGALYTAPKPVPFLALKQPVHVHSLKTRPESGELIRFTTPPDQGERPRERAAGKAVTHATSKNTIPRYLIEPTTGVVPATHGCRPIKLPILCFTRVLLREWRRVQLLQLMG